MIAFAVPQPSTSETIQTCVKLLRSNPSCLWYLSPCSSQGASFRSNFVSVIEKHLGSSGGGAVNWGRKSCSDPVPATWLLLSESPGDGNSMERYN